MLLSQFMLDLAMAGTRAEASHEPQGVLTSQWTHHVSDVLSQYSVDEEYNGRGVNQDVENGSPEA